MDNNKSYGVNKANREKHPVLKSYEAKVKDKTGIILGYLKYDEKKMQDTDVMEDKSDADAFLAQGQLKVGKDTAIVLDGLIMDDWHHARTWTRMHRCQPGLSYPLIFIPVISDRRLC